MPPSDHKRKDSLPARHRSHKGCWTCKRKRIQCDEIRPACQQCAKKGIACEGYEIRLRWGAGIASRGRFNGAQKPVQESIPPHSKRRWDLRGKVDHSGNDDQQGQPTLLLEQEFIQGMYFELQEPCSVCSPPIFVCSPSPSNEREKPQLNFKH